MTLDQGNPMKTITVTRKANAGRGWFLSDESNMIEVLQELTDWDGDVSRVEGVWQLTLRGSGSGIGRQEVIAEIGVWLVDDDGMRTVDKASFVSTYDADRFPPEAEPTD